MYLRRLNIVDVYVYSLRHATCCYPSAIFRPLCVLFFLGSSVTFRQSTNKPQKGTDIHSICAIWCMIVRLPSQTLRTPWGADTCKIANWIVRLTDFNLPILVSLDLHTVATGIHSGNDKIFSLLLLHFLFLCRYYCYCCYTTSHDDAKHHYPIARPLPWDNRGVA